MILTHFLSFMAAPAEAGVLASVGLRAAGGAAGPILVKSPVSVRDVATRWALEDGETISDSVWSVSPAEAGGLAVVAGSAAIEDDATGCRISGGVFRRVYQLTNTITTSRGQVLSETITVRIGLVEMTA